jgi:hypothetical protein
VSHCKNSNCLPNATADNSTFAIHIEANVQFDCAIIALSERATEAAMDNWQAVRAQYPTQWVLIEAYDAYTQAGQRIIPRLELIAAFGDAWDAAWARYKALHYADCRREYYVVHTDRAALDIGVIDAFGRVVES